MEIRMKRKRKRKMKIKVNAEGLIVAGKQGNPIYIAEEGDKFNGQPLKDGEEIELDPILMLDKITQLNAESKTHRLKYQDAAKKSELLKIALKDEELENLDEAKNNLRNIVQRATLYNESDSVAKEEIERQIEASKIAYEKQLMEQRNAYEDTLRQSAEKQKAYNNKAKSAMLRSFFSQSPYFNGEGKYTYLTPEIGMQVFGKYFDFENADDVESLKIVAFDDRGQKIWSKTRPNEPATFDESIAQLIDNYPDKNSILISNMTGGSGSTGGGSRIPGLPRTVTPDEAGDYLEEMLKGNVGLSES